MKLIGGMPVTEHTTSELEEELFYLGKMEGKIPDGSDPDFPRYIEVEMELTRRYGKDTLI
jgi:hypothetical protein